MSDMKQAQEAASRGRFYLDIARKGIVGLVFLGLFAWSVSLAQENWGSAGLITAFISYPVFVFGVLGLRSVLGDWLACRTLRMARLDPAREVTSGDRVAVSGRLRVQGEPLQSPFGAHACAAYNYLVAGSRRSASGSGSRTIRQNCLHGYHMLPTTFEGDGMILSLRAFPAVEADLTEVMVGKSWGEQARAWLTRVVYEAENPVTDEADSFAALLDARVALDPPLHRDYLISDVSNAGNSLTVEEEVVPVDVPVCILGTYEALEQGLSGRGGDLLVYRGSAGEVLGRLAGDIRRHGLISLVMVLIGGGICLAPLLTSA